MELAPIQPGTGVTPAGLSRGAPDEGWSSQIARHFGKTLGLPRKLSHPPPYLSVIRYTVIERRESGRRQGLPKTLGWHRAASMH
jgi:hypothetical protein